MHKIYKTMYQSLALFWVTRLYQNTNTFLKKSNNYNIVNENWMLQQENCCHGKVECKRGQTLIKISGKVHRFSLTLHYSNENNWKYLKK